VREFALRLPVDASVAIERMADEGFLAGVALDALTSGGDRSVSADDAARGLLVALTERRSRDEIDRYVAALDKAVR
jgi:glycine dehydrogenase subunit 1